MTQAKLRKLDRHTITVTKARIIEAIDTMPSYLPGLPAETRNYLLEACNTLSRQVTEAQAGAESGSYPVNKTNFRARLDKVQAGC